MPFPVRRTRTGREFSPWQQLGEAIAVDVDLDALLSLRYVEIAAAGANDDCESDVELENPIESSLLDRPQSSLGATMQSGQAYPSPTPTPSSASADPVPASPASESVNHRQRNSHSRRLKARTRAQTDAGTSVKGVGHKRLREAHDPVVVDLDAQDLPAAEGGWKGKRRDPPTKARTKDDLDAVLSQDGMRLIRYVPGSRPVVDQKRRMIALIAGKPRDEEKWTAVEKGIVEAIDKGCRGVTFSKKLSEHKRGRFPAPAIGISHGGGELQMV
ncbi:hypothetical protein BDZ89DRAFT_1144723 [Hymenopellis radicata]|nr:hypothetical protein BDZ89DRAFT_1144723 [Hymenopellis radicata]